MFTLSNKPFNPAKLSKGLIAKTTGALATFEGIVRNHNDGQSVRTLDYEAMEALCIKEANKIFKESYSKFKITNATCVHRVGKLKIGDIAIWVGVTSSHRDDAFQACRYIVDEIKTRLPIWKKEHYTNGDSGWVNCDVSSTGIRDQGSGIKDVRSPIPDPRSLFYSRQIILPQIGKAGQKKLKKAKVLVVGAGGLGSAALTSLAAAGVGYLGICEFDKLDASNLHRQTIYNHADIGKDKATLAIQRLSQLNPYIHLHVHPQRLDAKNIEKIIKPYDILIDGTDNFITKFLLNDAAVLFKKILIQASIYQFEGQLHVYRPDAQSACLRCLWPTTPQQSCVGDCAQAGVIGVIPQILGNLQATEALKLILGLEGTLEQETSIVNLLNSSMMKINRTPNPFCPACGKNRTITKIETFTMENKNAIDLNIHDIPKEEFSHYQLLDIREADERRQEPVMRRDCLTYPFSTFEKESFPFEREKKYLIFCSKGGRSHRMVEVLREQGITNTFSVINGVASVNAYFKKY